MRTLSCLIAGLLLTAALGACSDDPEPSSAGAATPTATPTATATASGTSTPTPTSTTTTAPTGTSTAAGTARPPASADPTSSQIRLTGDGIALPSRVLAFGTPYEQARSALDAGLGAPTTDTGVIDSFGPYGTCPGTQLRALEYGGGALVVLFGDVGGPGLTMYQWALTGQGRPSQVPPASAHVGDEATYEFGVGTTLAELRSGAAPAQLEVNPGDEILPASFRLQDQSSGLFGYLTGSEPQDTATFVQGGRACGE